MLNRVKAFGSLVGVVLLTAFFVGCGDDAGTMTVTANATPRTGLAPLDVAFSATTTGATGTLTYEWSFADGSPTESGANVTHTFTTAGSYDVLVTVVDSDGGTATDTVSIAAGDEATVAVVVTATPEMGRAPLDVTLGCVAVGGEEPYTYAWNFGDGTATTGQNVGHTYGERGIYSASCTAVDHDGITGINSATVTASLNDAPQAVASATFEGTDAPLAVAFVGHAIGGDGTITYGWSFGDGESSTDQNPSHTYTAAGRYRAVLTVTDEDGDRGVDVLTIDVSTPPTPDLPPTAVAEISTGACAVPGGRFPRPGPGTIVELDASMSADPEGAALTYEWVFVRLPTGSLATFNNTSIENPTFVPDMPGDYVLRVFVSDATHRVASSEVTVEAAEASVITAVSGGTQTAQAGESFAMPLVVQVENDCGAVVEDVFIDFSGTNVTMTTMPPPTDDTGQTEVIAAGGPRVGAATVVATLNRPMGVPTSVTFDLTVTAGDPARITMDPADRGIAGGGGLSLTFRITDRFGNVATAADTDFRVCVDPPMSFDATTPVDCADLTTSGGNATATVYSTDPGTVAVRMEPHADYEFAGWYLVASTDLESDSTSFRTGGDEASVDDWERGTPSGVGPSACASGTGCYGTNLSGNWGPSSAGYPQNGWFAIEVPPDSVFVSGPLERIELTQQEWYDVSAPGDQFGCPGSSPDGGAFVVSLWEPANSYGADYLEPERGYDVHGCTIRSPGMSGGESTGWVETTYSATLGRFRFGPPRMYWNLLRGGGVAEPGWYIDDVEVAALFFDRVALSFVTECSDGVDNDSDGVIDYPAEPGCDAPTDSDETDPVTAPACANGVDDDLDGSTDWPDDPDCLAASDDSEANTCMDGLDNDLDGWFDFMDPDCARGPGDEIGFEPRLECNNGMDDDLDFLIDADDPDCFDAFSREAGLPPPPPPPMSCEDGFDNDRDGWIDLEDPDCLMGPGDEVGFVPGLMCNDGIDNDLDFLIDRDDPECMDDPFNPDEGMP